MYRHLSSFGVFALAFGLVASSGGSLLCQKSLSVLIQMQYGDGYV
jgi:hypothetical protein